ncbi:MAG: hypothetical protein HY860_01610 [Chlamydiales bacterium]|nr:hypothetical protein [Chlamydiales bacterium]
MISLTDALVFNPIKHLSEQDDSCVASQLMTRVIAVSTSVFALIDTVASLLLVVAVGTYLTAKAICCLSSDLSDDYQWLCDLVGNVFKFTLLTLTGSVVGLFTPQGLNACCFNDDDNNPSPQLPLPPQLPYSIRAGNPSPPIMPVGPTIKGPSVTAPVAASKTQIVAGGIYLPPPNSGTSLAKQKPIDIDKETDAIDLLTALAGMIENGEIHNPFTELRDFLATATFATRRRFYEIFSESGIPQYAEVRAELADAIYQPLSGSEVKWLSNKELVARAEQLPTARGLHDRLEAKRISWDDNFHQGYYFHATKTKDLLLSILQSQILEVRQGCYFGAFISTQSEHVEYGNYVFVLKETVAHGSSQATATKTFLPGYWSGLSQDISLSDTLAYIMVARNSMQSQDPAVIDEECAELRGQIHKLFTEGKITREIPVIAHADIRDHQDQLTTLRSVIPKSWQRPGGSLILNPADDNLVI